MMEKQESLSFNEVFPPIDEKRTISNVQHFLQKTLPRMIRTSGRSLAALRSPNMDGMPKAPGFTNATADRITQCLYAEQVVRHAIEAMSHCDRDCQEILDQLYLQDYSDIMCYTSIGYSRSRYNHYWKPKALLQFADCYMLDDLHITKRDNPQK